MGATVRSGFTALAALALLVLIFVPRGFMPSGETGPPHLVICTGHGPLVLSTGAGKPAKAPRPEQPCAFAAHGAGARAPTPHPLGGAAIAFAMSVVAPVGDATPGRGLAAPPPPSRGPPSIVI